MVSKTFEKLVNVRFVDHVERYGLFLISGMVSGLLDQVHIFWRFISDRIDETFNRSETARAVALDISKAINKLSFY